MELKFKQEKLKNFCYFSYSRKLSDTTVPWSRTIRDSLSQDFIMRQDGRVLTFATSLRIEEKVDPTAKTTWIGRVNPKFEWDTYDAVKDIDARRKPGAPPILLEDSTKEDPKYTLLWDVSRSRVTQPDTLAGMTKEAAGPDIQLSISNETLTENMGAVDVASTLSPYFFLPVYKPEPDVIRVLLRPAGPYCSNGGYYTHDKSFDPSHPSYDPENTHIPFVPRGECELCEDEYVEKVGRKLVIPRCPELMCLHTFPHSVTIPRGEFNKLILAHDCIYDKHKDTTMAEYEKPNPPVPKEEIKKTVIYAHSDNQKDELTLSESTAKVFTENQRALAEMRRRAKEKDDLKKAHAEAEYAEREKAKAQGGTKGKGGKGKSKGKDGKKKGFVYKPLQKKARHE